MCRIRFTIGEQKRPTAFFHPFAPFCVFRHFFQRKIKEKQQTETKQNKTKLPLLCRHLITRRRRKRKRRDKE